jgi:hypothetical protein
MNALEHAQRRDEKMDQKGGVVCVNCQTHLDRLTPLRLFLHELCHRVLARIRRARMTRRRWRGPNLVLRLLFLLFAP